MTLIKEYDVEIGDRVKPKSWPGGPGVVIDIKEAVVIGGVSLGGRYKVKWDSGYKSGWLTDFDIVDEGG